MAAPVSPQGSRAGLITAVVIFVILFVASTIFAIYYQVQWTKSEVLLKDANARTDQVVRRRVQLAGCPGADDAGEEAGGSRDRRGAPPAVVAVADIAGSVLPAAKADTAAKSALQYATDRVAEAAASRALPATRPHSPPPQPLPRPGSRPMAIW